LTLISLLGYSFWLGFLTSVSPCPLSTNIAAIAYVGKDMKNPLKVILTGLVYTIARALTYMFLGVTVLYLIKSSAGFSHFMEKNMGKLLGPLLILVGMFLLELISFNMGSSKSKGGISEKVKEWNLAGAAILGILFALAFCPVSAALFFGSLIPVAGNTKYAMIAPFVFGIGTAIPVLVFTILLAFSSKLMGKMFAKTQKIEKILRTITGVLFIFIGLYTTVTVIFLA
jgi:cytochrome c-type biogenesis protein